MASKTELGDFAGGPVVKPPPYNAGHTGSTPHWGTKIPHTAEQLSHVPQLPHNLRVCASQQKILHDAMKILGATTKAPNSQTV